MPPVCPLCDHSWLFSLFFLSTPGDDPADLFFTAVWCSGRCEPRLRRGTGLASKGNIHYKPTVAEDAKEVARSIQIKKKYSSPINARLQSRVEVAHPARTCCFIFLVPAPSRLGPRREKIKLNGAQVYNRASLRLQADGGG